MAKKKNIRDMSVDELKSNLNELMDAFNLKDKIL